MPAGLGAMNQLRGHAPVFVAPDSGRGLPAPLELVLLRVRLRARIRSLWLRRFRDSATTFDVIGHDEIERILADVDQPAAEAAWAVGERQARAMLAELHAVEAALEAETGSRLVQLCRTLGLGPEERHALETCLAPALDPPLGRVYAWLQNDARREGATVALIDRLFGHTSPGWFSPGSALRLWSLVVERDAGAGEPTMLECDSALISYLLGSEELDPFLRGIGGVLGPPPPLSCWPVDLAARAARGALEARPPVPVRLRLVGADGSGRRHCAAAVARSLGLALLVLNADLVADDAWPSVFATAQRWAWLHGVALCWSGPAALARPWPEQVPWFPLQFASASSETLAAPPPRSALDRAFMLGAPGLADLRAVWLAHAPSASAWGEAALAAVISQAGSVGAAAAAADRAPATAEQGLAALRAVAREGLRDLAEPIACPFGWDDLVVSPATRSALEDFVFEARERAAVWDRAEARRLFPMGRGLLALLSGPPGTGKTMAAQVIAAALGRDLYRINLAALVSKYVGETARNIDRILKRHGDQFLLWDEADVVFAPRLRNDGAQEHFVNSEIGHLLQAIESYAGISLLTTNRRAEMDPAFTRRIRYLIDFAPPDAGQRERILANAVGAMIEPSRAALLLPGIGEIARAVECTGAQIKNAVLTAVFRARQQGVALALNHLIHGLERELAKDGRIVPPRLRQRLEA
jgi:hypothetical protein